MCANMAVTYKLRKRLAPTLIVEHYRSRVICFSKALIKSKRQGTSLFTSAALCERGSPDIPSRGSHSARHIICSLSQLRI